MLMPTGAKPMGAGTLWPNICGSVALIGVDEHARNDAVKVKGLTVYSMHVRFASVR